MNKIKIGIITNGNYVDKYTYDLIRWLKKNNKNFYFKHFISIPVERKKVKGIKVPKKILFRLIIFFENLILKIKKKTCGSFRQI